jgi:hypothetical protein
MFVFFDFMNWRTLEKAAGVEQNLFVPSAIWGGTPAASRAGTVMSPPPPAIESIMAAMNPAQHTKTILIMRYVVNIYATPFRKINNSHFTPSGEG